MGLGAGEMKEDDTENMLFTDQKCTVRPVQQLSCTENVNMKIFLNMEEVHKATGGGSAKIPYSQQKEIFPWSSNCFYNLFLGVQEYQ